MIVWSRYIGITIHDFHTVLLNSSVRLYQFTLRPSDYCINLVLLITIRISVLKQYLICTSTYYAVIYARLIPRAGLAHLAFGQMPERPPPYAKSNAAGSEDANQSHLEQLRVPGDKHVLGANRSKIGHIINYILY